MSLALVQKVSDTLVLGQGHLEGNTVGVVGTRGLGLGVEARIGATQRLGLGIEDYVWIRAT